MPGESELWIGPLDGTGLRHYHEAPFPERFWTGSGMGVSPNSAKLAIHIMPKSGPSSGKTAFYLVPLNGGTPKEVFLEGDIHADTSACKVDPETNSITR